ncbi:MAG: glycosyltransferase family 39 protein, partial [Acidobacteria bacterium]|nr:glycosyltransferase family 39 protein [Acidobacteriota bacterium]
AGQAAAQLIQPLCFALMLGALGWTAARAGASPVARLSGVLTVAALPFLAWTGGVAKNDIPMALFQTLTLGCILAATGERRTHWLRLAVFFLAASFSVKATAMFGAVPLALLLLWRLRDVERKPREVLLWTATFALVAGVWPLRTYLLTGNPLYPAEISWAVESLRPNAMRPAEWRSIPYWKIPWTIHFDGTQAFESPSANPAGFFLWLFAPLWLVLRRREGSRAEALCLVFAWVYFFYWGSVWPVVRYAIVPLGLLMIFTMDRLVTATALLPRGWRPVLVTITALNGVACLLSAMIFSVNAPQLALFAGRIGEQEYLRRAILPYPALEHLAQNWRPGDWTLGVGVTAAAYAPDPAKFDCERTADAVASAALAHDLLAGGQYRFLMTSRPAGDAVLRDLPPHLVAQELYADAHYALYSLERAAAGTAPHR